MHDRKKWHNFISAENRNNFFFQIVYFTDKEKNPKGRPRARMTSPSDGSPNTVFAAMFLRARMTSPSDGSPNTVFAAMFLRARMTSPSDGPLFTSGIYTTRTLSASQYPLLLSPVPSMEVITSKVDKSYVLMVLCTSNSGKGVTSAGDVHSVPSLAAKVLWVGYNA